MNPWIRLYRDSLHNPKLVTLNDRQFRAWHNAMLMADDTGTLPKMRDIACHIRMTVQEAEQLICDLVEAGLVDIQGTGPDRCFVMHDWGEHQYVSDSSTERVRKFRRKSKNEGNETLHETERNVTVTPPESYTDTDTDPKGLLSSNTAMRAKEDQRGLKLFSEKRDDRTKERLVRRAEGLGLNVDDLTKACNAHKAKNRSAYFTKLCVERLKASLPGVDEQLVRSALWDADEAALRTVERLLLGVAA